MEDITPALLERLQKRFAERIAANPKIRALDKKIREGKATYADAEDYAYLIGAALSDVFRENLSSAVLPDGKMYFNIAERILGSMLGENHRIVSEATQIVQEALNKSADLGLKAQLVPVNQNRIVGLVNKIAKAEIFDDVAWVLDEPVKNFTMAVVDDMLKANVEFQGKAGLSPVIVRKAAWRCCEWCTKLEGIYSYPVGNNDIYRRHERCRCRVEFDPKTGRKQDVYSKSWKSS